MNALIQQPFGFRLYEYLLIIEPVAPVQKQLRAFKQYFLKSYRYPNAIVSKSHITLMRFIQYDSYEKRIIEELQRLAISVVPFDVELRGFGSFGHTLFVDVASAGSILDLISKRRQVLRPLLSNSKSNTPYFVTKPHVTIARNLTPSQSETIWPVWRKTSYHSTFRAKHMILLKRMVGTNSYSVVRKFNFLGILPQFTQGKLFA